MKKKGNGIELAEPDYAPSLYLDFEDAEEAQEFAKDGVGKTVTVVIKGKLSSITIGDNGNNSIRIQKYSVEKVDNGVFSELADD